MKHLELTRQLELQRAGFKTELKTRKTEKLAHARDSKLPYFDEIKILEVRINGIIMFGSRI